MRFTFGALALAAGFAAFSFAQAQDNVVALPPAPATPVAPAAPPRPLTVTDGQAIEQAFRAAPEFPFPPDLVGAVANLANRDPSVQADADAVVTRAAVKLAAEERGRLTDASTVDPDWALRPAYDAAADFAKARAAGTIADWADALPRRDPTYLALIAAWRKYDDLRAAGGWPEIPVGAPLARGSKGKDVVLLRRRLAAEGYGEDDLDNHVFNPGLVSEVADFQRRHGLKPSGALNADTVQALNVTAGAREATIDANLERARWLPDQLPPDRVEADIAAAEVTLFKDDEPSLTMRAIVGDTKHLTPLFASHISAIEFNPPWHVPTSIAKAELYPKEARSHGYFARHGFSVIDGQLVQHAGPQSSLGRVKFDMPDPFSVYLHDTPGRSLFAVDSRGRSHGCVRLEKPKDLALALLSGQGWTAERIDTTIAKGATQWVRPAKTMPVYLVYRTAVADGDDPVIFRPDLYGWDMKLNAALTGGR
jgi:murein L,D-transpeptidase YcbB/YkuD